MRSARRGTGLRAAIREEMGKSGARAPGEGAADLCTARRPCGVARAKRTLLRARRPRAVHAPRVPFQRPRPRLPPPVSAPRQRRHPAPARGCARWRRRTRALMASRGSGVGTQLDAREACPAGPRCNKAMHTHRYSCARDMNGTPRLASAAKPPGGNPRAGSAALGHPSWHSQTGTG